MLQLRSFLMAADTIFAWDPKKRQKSGKNTWNSWIAGKHKSLWKSLCDINSTQPPPSPPVLRAPVLIYYFLSSHFREWRTELLWESTVTPSMRLEVNRQVWFCQHTCGTCTEAHATAFGRDGSFLPHAFVEVASKSSVATLSLFRIDGRIGESLALCPWLVDITICVSMRGPD